MKKIGFIIGPLFLAAVIAFVTTNMVNKADAVSIPTTFSSGAVLTAAQLNSNNTAIYNAFNGHNHDGGDGEPSSLAFTGATASFNAGGDITFNSATGSLECDGTTATEVLIDQNNFDVFVGSGTETSEEQIIIRANTGDAALDLRVNNTSANTWKMYNDNSDSDNLKFNYGAGNDEVIFNASGGIATGQTSNFIAWETYSGTMCSPATCTTDVDTSAPGSGAPFGFVCLVENGSGFYHSPGGVSGSFFLFYDEAADDLSITIGTSTYEGEPYKCIVYYNP